MLSSLSVVFVFGLFIVMSRPENDWTAPPAAVLSIAISFLQVFSSQTVVGPFGKRLNVVLGHILVCFNGSAVAQVAARHVRGSLE